MLVLQQREIIIFRICFRNQAQKISLWKISLLCPNASRIHSDTSGWHSHSPSFSPPVRDISTKCRMRGHPAMDDATGFWSKKTLEPALIIQDFGPFDGDTVNYAWSVLRRRAAPGSFPCMPCICRVIDGCVNFIGARYRYEPGLSSSTRRLRYAGLASRCESERVIFLGAINLPPILIQGSESATVNGRTIERRYPTRIFFVGRVTHRRTRERVLPSSVTRPVS